MTPGWAVGFPWPSIKAAATKWSLDPLLVAAFIGTESGGLASRTRYEKGFRWLVEPAKFAANLGITEETEVIAQAHSYGLMQVMGGTARGLGYSGFLVDLCQVDLGLLWGCNYLSHCMARWPVLEEAISAYNAGSPRDQNKDGQLDNHSYVAAVLGRLEELRDAVAKPLA